MRARGALTTAVLLLAALIAAPAHARTCADLPEPSNGRDALATVEGQLADVADDAGLTTAMLRRELRRDPSLWLDRCARAFYVEPEPVRAPLFEPALETGGDALSLHSRPGSQHVLYLDFDGYDVGASAWANDYGDFTAPRSAPTTIRRSALPREPRSLMSGCAWPRTTHPSTST